MDTLCSEHAGSIASTPLQRPRSAPREGKVSIILLRRIVRSEGFQRALQRVVEGIGVALLRTLEDGFDFVPAVSGDTEARGYGVEGIAVLFV